MYCYDEMNRTTWAGSTGTAPCGTLTAGTLTAANYQQSYAFDTLNRLTTGPSGSVTYGDPNHLDAVTSAPGYTASYDPAGNMTTRNGQPIAYDALGRQTNWQNTATSPTQSATYAYNGEGERVQQVVTTSGTTTTTNYIGANEEVSTTGSTTTTTKYYDAGGVASVANVNGTLSYLVKDPLGSITMALDNAGNVTATALYSPYGTTRYSTGAMPTDRSYTSMTSDPSGLYYDHARYYDSGVGQFTSADTVQGPNRYGYVAGNPETNIDPTGNSYLAYDYAYFFYDFGGWFSPPPPSPQALLRMAIYRFAVYFPFTWGCGWTIHVGEVCSLDGIAPIRVMSITSTSFTFLSLPGHPEGANRLITFFWTLLWPHLSECVFAWPVDLGRSSHHREWCSVCAVAFVPTETRLRCQNWRYQKLLRPSLLVSC